MTERVTLAEDIRQDDVEENRSAVLVESKTDTNKQSPDTSQESQQCEPAIENIVLKVSVELGHFQIDASNADELTPGKILRLHTDCPGSVKLIYGGDEIGRGELVDIDGKLAVRIRKNWSQ